MKLAREWRERKLRGTAAPTGGPSVPFVPWDSTVVFVQPCSPQDYPRGTGLLRGALVVVSPYCSWSTREGERVLPYVCLVFQCVASRDLSSMVVARIRGDRESNDSGSHVLRTYREISSCCREH